MMDHSGIFGSISIKLLKKCSMSRGCTLTPHKKTIEGN